jgi:hypothetical protein
MKSIKLILVAFLISVSIFSCKKTDDILSPVNIKNIFIHNLKTMQDATVIVNGTSIQSAIDTAVPGTLIGVVSGTYNEQIILKDSVDLFLEEGVIINYNSLVPGATITDNGVVVHCEILGNGIIKRSAATDAISSVIAINNIDVINLEPISHINIFYKLIESSNYYAATIYIRGGNIILNGDSIIGEGYGIEIYKTGYPIVEWTGGVIYSRHLSGISNWSDFIGIGIVNSDGSSAISCFDGYTEFSGYAQSTAMFGIAQWGGTVYIHDALIESTYIGGTYCQASAITKESIDTLTLSNVILKCAHPLALAITSTVSNIVILDTSYANRSIQILPIYPIISGSDKLYSIPITNLVGVGVFHGNPKTVTLTWQSENDNFEIWKDGIFQITVGGLMYCEYITGGFQHATYTIYSVIPTLEKSKKSITITKH